MRNWCSTGACVASPTRCQPAFGSVLLQFLFAGIYDHERQRPASEFTRGAAPHATSPANDEVPRQPADFAVHASPAEYRLQLEF